MRIIRLILLLLWILLWLVPVAIAYALKKKRVRGMFAQYASWGMVRMCGLRVTVVGVCAADRPLLIVSNHLSYLDIPIIGSAMDCRFVPKKEIASWPVIGFICKILGAVFIDRNVKKIGEGQEAIRAALAAGEVVVLFPEATTGDGKHLLPFKPAFFEAAAGVMVQPVAICYRKVRGLPMDYGKWPLVAWYGDMLLLPHLWTLLSLGRIDVELHFLPPISSIGMDRKALAAAAQEAISAVVSL